MSDFEVYSLIQSILILTILFIVLAFFYYLLKLMRLAVKKKKAEIKNLEKAYTDNRE